HDLVEKDKVKIKIIKLLKFLTLNLITLDEIRGQHIQKYSKILDPNQVIADSITKLVNFGISRGFNEATKNLDKTIDTIRYMTPEKLKTKKTINTIIIEIAEEKCHMKKKQLADIISVKKIRKGFSSDVPSEWKTIFKERRLTLDPQPSDPELSLEDAIKEYYKENGDKTKSWKIFIKFENSGNLESKYWASLYLYHDICNKPIDETEKYFRARRAAAFFKESADERDMSNTQS
ncbi:27836_t:CDS:2, partial [Gigaspora margarita]